MNPLLYGHNPDEHIVAVQQLNDSSVRIYKRSEENIIHEDAEFFPFFFLADAALLQGFTTFHWLKELTGDRFFKYLVAFKRWSDMWEAVNHVIREYNKNRKAHATSYADVDALLLRPDPVYQYLMQSGKTSFKGLTFEDLHRVQIDIQVYSSYQRRRGPLKKHERIIVISLYDNNRWKHQIDARKLDEKEMLEQFVHILRRIDPDIIEGHELFSFQLPLIVERCELHGIDLRLGRDDSPIRTFQKRFWSEDEFTAYECPGRHFIDTHHLVRAYDYSKRSLENYSLAHLAQHFKIKSPLRLPSAKASMVWDEKSQELLQASREKARLTKEISDLLSPANFYLAQMCPFNYGTLVELGSSARLESLLVREYLREKCSIPQPQKGSQSVGGYTDLFVSGVIENVLQADVESLYPSIVISGELKPHSDHLNVFVPLLEELTRLRLNTKSKMRRSESHRKRSQYDAMQSSFKILINSFYGYLAYSKGLFNDYGQADAVTSKGQEILRSIIRQMQLFNADVIEVDTDGIYFVPPDNVRGRKNEEVFVHRISKTLPRGINLVLGGRFKKMLSYRMKNYALLDPSNRLIIKGSSLISRSLERFARAYIQRCIECLLTGDIARLHHTYASFFTQIKNHRWDPSDFSRIETLHEDLAAYNNLVELGERHPSAAYEAAKKAGLYLRPGDRVSYYVTGSHAEVKISGNCRVSDEWDPNLPDENTPYYLARLEEYSEKFKTFFEPENFKKIFSLDDLFGFSPAGIKIVTKKILREPVLEDDAEVEKNEDFPIWLEENA